MDERYGLLNELLQVKFANIENELALNSLFEIIPERDSGTSNIKSPLQPGYFEYEGINHKFRVVPATLFPEPIHGDNLEKTIEEALNNYEYLLPKELYAWGKEVTNIDSIIRSDKTINLYKQIAKRDDIMKGLKIIAQFFGKQAFMELLSRLRWRKSEFLKYCHREYENQHKKKYYPQLIPRLLLHVVGHFRELARCEHNYRDAFFLENLGWIVLSLLRNEIKSETGVNWWMPDYPWFFTGMPLENKDKGGGLLLSQEIWKKTSKLGIPLYYNNFYVDSYKGQRERWINSMPGKLWFKERYSEKGRCAFFSELVKDKVLPISVMQEKEDAKKEYEKYFASMTKQYKNVAERNKKLSQGIDSDKYSAAFRTKHMKNPHIDTQKVQMVNEFPRLVEEITRSPKYLKNSVEGLDKLRDQIEYLFKTIYELGWNDLIYDIQGLYYFRGNGGDINKISNHGLGIAMDINAQENPRLYSKKVVISKIGAMDPRVIALFDAFHFKWGGVFSDPHHFEYRIYSEEDVKNGRTIQAVHYI